jgi:hypothetical protein
MHFYGSELPWCLQCVFPKEWSIARCGSVPVVPASPEAGAGCQPGQHRETPSLKKIKINRKEKNHIL